MIFLGGGIVLRNKSHPGKYLGIPRGRGSKSYLFLRGGGQQVQL